jgi:hypothetical protein
LRPDWQMKARELADLWQRYMVGQQQSLPKTPQQAMASQPSPVTAEIKYASS